MDKTTFTASVVIVILSPLIVAGNALVLAAIWRKPSIRTPSYILLAGVAVTDFGTGLLSMPFYAAKDLMPRFIIVKGIAVCFTSYFSLMTMLIVTFMAIERWLHMTHRAQVTRRKACYLVAVTFILPIPLAVLRVQGQRYHRDAFDIVSTLLLLSSLLVTTVVYFKIFRIIPSHQNRVSHAGESSLNEHHPSINHAKYKKSVVSIIYILAVFYFGYAPLIIVLVIFFFLPTAAVQNISNMSVLHVLMVFVFLASCLNPLLYMLRMKDIRDEVKRVVKGMSCKCT